MGVCPMSRSREDKVFKPLRWCLGCILIRLLLSGTVTHNPVLQVSWVSTNLCRDPLTESSRTTASPSFLVPPQSSSPAKEWSSLTELPAKKNSHKTFYWTRMGKFGRWGQTVLDFWKDYSPPNTQFTDTIIIFHHSIFVCKTPLFHLKVFHTSSRDQIREVKCWFLLLLILQNLHCITTVIE